MNLEILEKQKILSLLKEFVKIFKERPIKDNIGGMGSPDMFSLWYAIKTIKPSVIIESGVYKGASTWIIRQASPHSKIICIDPNKPAYKEKLARYYTERKFKDFSKLNINFKNEDKVFCFFDDHINAYKRLIQCRKKKIKHLFFNDNYPVKCGSHLTLEHCLNRDKRFLSKKEYISRKNTLERLIDKYYIFPNIIGGNITTKEGNFTCKCLFANKNEIEEDYREIFDIFIKDSKRYRWNTYVKLVT